MNLAIEIKPWLGVFLAFFATFFWRCLGLILAERISSTGLLMRWINAVAYSMVAGVLMLILVNPTGILLTSTLLSRLAGLFFGILAIYFTKNILFSIAIGIGFFVLLTSL
ncbi:MAG: AzlD domain-containing protein [Paracoccaceae bacterium]|nr:AzlD domain-containing protein [Paracoccaceae bacterium]